MVTGNPGIGFQPALLAFWLCRRFLDAGLPFQRMEDGFILIVVGAVASATAASVGTGSLAWGRYLSGIGLSSEVRQNLFDPFVTTKAGGTGLGLPLVAKIVGDHGGIIEFTSESAHTAFRVYLPVYQGPIDQETEKSDV